MSASTTQDTNIITGGKRAAIKEMIDKTIVTVDIPHCDKIKFLPRRSIDSIATLPHIVAYIQEEFGGRWPEPDIEKLAKDVHEKAKKLFIAVAKNNWTAHLLNGALEKSKYEDEQIGTKFPTYDEYDIKGGIRDQAVKEMEIHLANAIQPGEFNQIISRTRLPFTHAYYPLAPLGKPNGPLEKWEVTLHEDYWDKSKKGLTFILLVLDRQPDETKEGDAVAGFWSEYEGDQQYWMLFPKDTVWLDKGIYETYCS